MITVLSLVALAGLFGWLALTDLRRQQVGLVFTTLRRKDRPIPFWTVVAVEIALALLLTFVAIVAFQHPANCDNRGICTVYIEATTS
ncbi:MAG: hypothetical protein WBL74_01800 [Novosphingobium sp.]|uniref:hypothetical protein n=1 Tax=Novosphingobium sp. TaxID=1874826 RepID=UPI003C7CF860